MQDLGNTFPEVVKYHREERSVHSVFYLQADRRPLHFL